MRIGVDLGGTKIRVGLITPDGNVMEMLTENCPNDRPEAEVVECIAAMVGHFFGPEVEAIGVGVPAIVDARGVVYDCVNIPSWKRVELKAMLESRFHVPVRVNNDCNCFALGIKASSYGKGFDDLVCITLGTGVGSGIIVNGQLYAGKNCGAGEIGGIQYKDKDYEFYCSSQFFKSKGTSGKDVFVAAEAGDPAALALWDEFGANVGDLLIMAAFAYDPQAIVLGGSISSAYKYFEKSMMERFSHFPYTNVVKNIKIISDAAGDFMLTGSCM